MVQEAKTEVLLTTYKTKKTIRESDMSRSYKRVPCCKDHTRGMKKCANRHVRRNYMTVPSGMAYKKLFCSWNICDYKFLESFSSYKKAVSKYNHRKYSDKELFRKWYKDYKMK